jgi:hypothetical protein
MDELFLHCGIALQVRSLIINHGCAIEAFAEALLLFEVKRSDALPCALGA